MIETINAAQGPLRKQLFGTTSFNNARDDWNNRTNQFTLVRVNTQAERDFKARNNFFGDAVWSGLWHKDGNTQVGPACNSGNWVPKDGVASINTRFNDTNGLHRKGVAIHEFGHAMGLAHENLTQPGCAGGDPGYISIMYLSDNRFNGNCAVYVPTNDDTTGIGVLH